MARKTKAAAQQVEQKPVRMKPVNVNDGKSRVIITMKPDSSGIESVGRYNASPSLAVTLLVESLPAVRAEEIESLVAERQAISEHIANIIGNTTPAEEAQLEAAAAAEEQGALDSLGDDDLMALGE